MSSSSKIKVVVNIMGKEYTIVGCDSREHVQRVANLVDDKMNEVASDRSVAATAVPVLAALNVADDYLKLVYQHDDLNARLENPTLEIKILREELTDLKRMYHEKTLEHEELNREFDKLSKSIAEYEQGIVSFREKLSDVNKELAKVKTDYETSKNRIEPLVEENDDMKNNMNGLKADNKIIVEQIFVTEAENNAIKIKLSEKDEEIKYLLDCLEVYETGDIDAQTDADDVDVAGFESGYIDDDLDGIDEIEGGDRLKNLNISDSPTITEYGSIRINPKKEIL